jgi:hypothetical protein
LPRGPPHCGIFRHAGDRLRQRVPIAALSAFFTVASTRFAPSRRPAAKATRFARHRPSRMAEGNRGVVARTWNKTAGCTLLVPDVARRELREIRPPILVL